MKKYTIVLFLMLMALLCAVSTTHSAELAKQGSGKYLSGKSGTFDFLKLGEKRFQMNWDSTGVFVEAPENSPFLHTSYHSIGTLHGYNGKTESTGGIVFTRPNGDQIFGTIVTTGVVRGPQTSLTVEFTGGTGECAGITGKMVGATRPKVKSSTKGGWQAIGPGTVTWNIP